MIEFIACGGGFGWISELFTPEMIALVQKYENEQNYKNAMKVLTNDKKD